MRLLVLILALCTLSCSLERYSSKSDAEVRLVIPRAMLEEKPHLAGGPGSYATIDCFLLDVNGPGISGMYSESNPFANMDLGLNTAWVSRTDLIAQGATTMSVRVPIGRSRTVRILGVKGATPITDCAAQSFKGYPSSGMFKQPPYPLVYEIARSTIDVFTAKAVETTQEADPAEDMIPTNSLTVSAQSAFYVGNTDPAFGEGAPPAAGPFDTFIAPMSTDDLAGRTRFDFILSVHGQNVRAYRGLQVTLQAQGGGVACGGPTFPAVTEPSDLQLAIWDEGAGQWISQGTAVPYNDQNVNHRITFSGLNFESVRLNVTHAVTYQGLWMSLRVKNTPTTGCSAINFQGVTATLFQ